MTKNQVLSDEVEVDAFRRFVLANEPRLRQALSASLGSQVGRDAAADALSHAWENWERLELMENPTGLAGVSAGEMARATGLSRPYCSMIRRGAYVPHPKHWEALSALLHT